MIDRTRNLSADELGWDMAGPCDDCPFRRNAPDHEGVCASIVEYIQMIQSHHFAHTCHKTDNRADGPGNYTGRIQHCGGALHFLVRAQCDLQVPLLDAATTGKIDIKELTSCARADEGVFSSTIELVEYYLAMSNRIMAAKAADPDVWALDPEKPFERSVLLRASEVQSRGLEVVTCKLCDQPATQIDRFWPNFTTENYCAAHGGRSSAGAVNDLAKLAQKAGAAA